MICTGKLTAIFGLAAILACSSPAGTEPNDANTPLMFEISPTELPLSRFVQERTNLRSSPWKETVAYAAGIPYIGDVGNPSGPTQAMNRFTSFALRHHVSEEQRRFLEAMSVNVQGRGDDRIYTPLEDPNSRQILLHAVSLEDAKKMARAFVEYTQDRFNQQVAEQRATIEKLSERVTAWPKRLTELAQAEETTTKELEEVRNRVPYRSEQQALDAAAELDKLLNTAQVEIAGIQAKIAAIQKWQSEYPGPTILEQLKAIFVEESIALQAAEARRRMATELRKRADKYIDLTQALPRITKERDQIAGMLPHWSKRLEEAQQGLSGIMQHEPRIIDDKVYIYRIEGADAPAKN